MEDVPLPLPLPVPLPIPVPIPAALTAEEEDELEALIPPATAAAAAARDDDDEEDDGLEEHYRALQDALGEGPGQGEGKGGEQGDGEGEGEEPPAEALGAEALRERCARRLRGIEAALDDYEVRGNGMGMGCPIWMELGVESCVYHDDGHD